jgi:hypothetical protein
MPGPFPGMDPFLENRSFWRGVHQGLITFINQQLNETLPSGFAANMDERCYLVHWRGDLYPDVAVVARAPEPGPVAAARSARGRAPHVLELPAEEVREPFVEIVTATPERELVAVIEVLSPTNKAAETEGYEEYRRKQRHLLGSAVHLLEIDLLRSGAHTVAAPEWWTRTLPPFDYSVCLSRAGSGRREVWDVRLADPLPVVDVPLFDDTPPAALDLQSAFDRMYDAGPYRRLVDYRADPDPPLAPDAADWADALLKSRGLRTA